MSLNETLSNDGATEPTQTTPDGGSEGPQNSSNTAETPQPRNDAEIAAEVEAILNPPETGPPEGETDQSGAEPPGEAEPPADGPEIEPDDPKPVETLADAAEKLGIDQKTLYDLKLTTGDGETVTLGQVKDLWQGRETAQRESAKREAELDQRETAISNELQLWAELGDQLVTRLTPQQKATLQAQVQARSETERRKMITAMPEFNDPATYDQFRLQATDFLVKEYGFNPAEVNVTDHRHIRIIRDFMRLKGRMDELAKYKPKAKVPETKTAPKGRGQAPNANKRLINNARGGSESQKVDAVSALLKG